MEILKIFIGFDQRQMISYNVLQQSIFRNSSKPVAITPLVINKDKYQVPYVQDQLPMSRQGLTPFTFSRFLVPYLCNYEGWALFLDSDILVKGDIAELFNFKDDKYAIMVSKNEKHRFEWASVMLYNNAKNKILTPEYVDSPKTQGLHTINWCKEEEVGDLPRKWNHLVGYDDEKEGAKLIHYTQGNPCWDETKDCEYSKDWQVEAQNTMSRAEHWSELMGNSVHAIDINGKRVPKYHLKRAA